MDLIFLLKMKLEGGISSGRIGVSSSIRIAYELGVLKLVIMGVSERIIEVSAVEFSGLVIIGTT
jgi:hypothetical protein